MAVLVGLFWVQFQSPIVLDGQSFALFDPALWSFWLPWVIGVTVLEIGFAIALYLRGRWTYGFAVANAVLGDVAAAAADVGIEAGSPEASELARRLAEVELGR